MRRPEVPQNQEDTHPARSTLLRQAQSGSEKGRCEIDNGGGGEEDPYPYPSPCGSAEEKTVYFFCPLDFRLMTSHIRGKTTAKAHRTGEGPEKDRAR